MVSCSGIILSNNSKLSILLLLLLLLFNKKFLKKEENCILEILSFIDNCIYCFITNLFFLLT